jgi:hypothetical protein
MHLQSINSHNRDNNIQFFEYGHKYKILTDPNCKYTSVTTWIHNQFPKFNADEIILNMTTGDKWKPGHKYWGMTPSEIKASWNTNGNVASSSGTNMHYSIECFMNNPNLSHGYTQLDLFDAYLKKQNDSNSSDSPEWIFFTKFIQDFPELKPYRTEWMVYHEELRLAGSIDMIYEHDDGELSIYDWKRSKEISKCGWGKFGTSHTFKLIPNCNFWHYSLQLNVYRHIIETKYGKKIKNLYLVRLHPNNIDETYDLISVPKMNIFSPNPEFQVQINPDISDSEYLPQAEDISKNPFRKYMTKTNK